MTRHFKFNQKKKKNVRKKEVDCKRIIGFTTLKNPIYGSKSNLIKPF